MKISSQQRGRDCEDQALNDFLKKGYQLLCRNHQVFGVEVDLILKKEDIYYFIEVKSNNLWREQKPLHYKQKNRLIEAVSMFSEMHHISTSLVLAIVYKDKVKTYKLDEDLVY